MKESRTQLLARLREQRRKAGIGEFKNKTAKRTKSRSYKAKNYGGNMTKKKHSRKSSHSGGGMFEVKKALTIKNLLATAAGAYVGTIVGQPKLAAAGASYFLGKGGYAGAAIGYFAAPTINTFTGNILGTTLSTGSSTTAAKISANYN